MKEAPERTLIDAMTTEELMAEVPENPAIGKPLSAPERIWLQHSDPYDPTDENTWADHRVDETEAETPYLRADAVEARLEAAEQMEAALKLLRDEVQMRQGLPRYEAGKAADTALAQWEAAKG